MFGDRDVSNRISKQQITNWEAFEQLAEEWKHQDQFGTAVWDVAEESYDCCFDFMCDGQLTDEDGLVVEHPADADDWGKSWRKIKKRYAKVVNRFVADEKGLVVISHVRVSERKDAAGDTVEDAHPAVSGQALEVLFGKADLVGYYHIRHGKRVLQIRPTDDVCAKCRSVENFIDTAGKPIKFIPMGNSAKEAHNNLVKAFHNKQEGDKPKEKTTTRRKRRPVGNR